MTVTEEQELVSKARRGDYAAFEELVRRHEDRVYSIAMNTLRQEQDAEDVVQNVFLSALRGLSGFRGEAAFGTWLTRIAINASLKALRARRKERTEPYHMQEGDSGVIEHPEAVGPWQTDPVHMVERRVLREIMDDAIEQLDDRHRLVFVLRDIEGLSTRETARELGISEANVKVRLLRARLALRERLAKRFGGDRVSARDAVHDHEDARATPVAELIESYRPRSRGTRS